jgi:hypothetical protein
MNLTVGGLFGYASSNCMISLKVPSSNGVSAGPMITAFLGECQPSTLGMTIEYEGGRANHVMTLSAMGEAETPAGGSVCIRYLPTLASDCSHDVIEKLEQDASTVRDRGRRDPRR